MKSQLRIFLTACEPSGDKIGAALIRELKALVEQKALLNEDEAIHSLEFFGIGGPMMREAGQVQSDTYDGIAVMGFLEVILHIPKILYIMRRTVKTALAVQPDIVITIDAPDFSSRIVKKLRAKLKKKNTKFVQYVAPTVWAYGSSRVKKFKDLYDHIMLLFPFEKSYFKEMGHTVVGHPICDEEEKMDMKGEKDRKIVSIFAGSRKQELKMHMPVLLPTIKKINNLTDSEFTFVFHTLPYIKEDLDIIIDNFIKESFSKEEAKKINVITIDDEANKKSFLRETKFALVKSGTVTIEIAKLGIPMAVFYKVSRITAYFLSKKLFIDKICLVNIISGEDTVEELVQDDFNEERIINAFFRFAKSDAVSYDKFVDKLSTGEKPSKVAAACILKLALE